MFELTRRHMPATDTVQLLDMAVFNVLICNTDAHGKNYSMLIRGNGASLAPMYDVMCGDVWENVTKRLSQKIAGESRGEQIEGDTGSDLLASEVSIQGRCLTASAPWRNLRWPKPGRQRQRWR
jgi:hypothetical protein